MGRLEWAENEFQHNEKTMQREYDRMKKDLSLQKRAVHATT